MIDTQLIGTAGHRNLGVCLDYTGYGFLSCAQQASTRYFFPLVCLRLGSHSLKCDCVVFSPRPGELRNNQ